MAICKVALCEAALLMVTEAGVKVALAPVGSPRAE